jgi:hypothetical protein
LLALQRRPRTSTECGDEERRSSHGRRSGWLERISPAFSLREARMNTTRERKIKFINSFGHNAMRTAVTEAYCRNGVDWLTDEQLDEIVRDQISNWKFTKRLNRRNREINRRSSAQMEVTHAN